MLCDAFISSENGMYKPSRRSNGAKIAKRNGDIQNSVQARPCRQRGRLVIPRDVRLRIWVGVCDIAAELEGRTVEIISLLPNVRTETETPAVLEQITQGDTFAYSLMNLYISGRGRNNYCGG